MMRRLLFVLLLTIPAGAQTTYSIAANVPTYNFQLEAGSTRVINVSVAATNGSTASPCTPTTTPACVGTINWSVLSTTGGASVTFSDPTHTNVSTISGGLAAIQITAGATAGTCSISGSVGSFVVSSTASATLKAVSTDDVTKSATILVNVCNPPPCTSNALSNGFPCVPIVPAYQQAYQGQTRTLTSWVLGFTNENVTWAITAQPAGGNGTLADTTYRDTQFSATVTGRYTIKATSVADGSRVGSAIVYVSTNPLPSYAATPNKTEPRECAVDPSLTGADYEVGAGKAYANLAATPSAGTLSPGTIIRVWNTDTTGLSPSVYTNYYQFYVSGTPTQPMILCGVPDSLGNLPIIDGNNATGQAGVSVYAAAGWGVISSWAGGYGSGTPYGYWQSGSAGPSYLSVTGLHIRNATPSYTFTQPGGTSAPCEGGSSATTCPYIVGASCVNLRSGTFIDTGGNDLDTCTNGFFSAENSNSAWAPITQAVSLTGNHIHGSGWAEDATEHQMYVQSFYAVVSGNLLDNYLSTAEGSNIKWRGVEGIFSYNSMAHGPARMMDLVDNQDAIPYVNFEVYLGSTGLYQFGDTGGAPVLAMFQEGASKDFVYGNQIFAGYPAENAIHYNSDHDSGMADRNGTLYFYSNTMDSTQIAFDTDDASCGGCNSYYQPFVKAQNNILWASQGGYTGGTIAFNYVQQMIFTGTTNLMQTGSFGITTPITGGSFNARTAGGWQSGCADTGCYWNNSNPLDPHIYGLSSANYMATATQPYTTGTLIPISGSPAIGAGTALSGLPAQLPVRYQWVTATNSLSPRTQPLTIGAEDYVGSATASHVFSGAIIKSGSQVIQ